MIIYALIAPKTIDVKFPPAMPDLIEKANIDVANAGAMACGKEIATWLIP